MQSTFYCVLAVRPYFVFGVGEKLVFYLRNVLKVRRWASGACSNRFFTENEQKQTDVF